MLKRKVEHNKKKNREHIGKKRIISQHILNFLTDENNLE